MKSETARNRPL